MKADKLGISGDVRNMPNGTVFGHAQGTEYQIEQFIKWLHEGSPKSRVDKVLIKDIEESFLDGFTILR